MKFVSVFLTVSLFCNLAFAECDFSKGIKTLPNGNYEYTEECHIKVGKLVKENQNKDEQIALLNQAIDLKNLALQKSDERINLWMDTSYKLEDRLNKVDSMRSTNNVLHYGLGIATAILAVWAAGQLR